MAGTKPIRRVADQAAQVDELVRHAEQSDRVEITNGQLIAGVMAAGATITFVRHSLGRAYRGAMLVGSSAFGLAVAAPSGAQTTQFVTVTTATAPGTDASFNLWVF